MTVPISLEGRPKQKLLRASSLAQIPIQIPALWRTKVLKMLFRTGKAAAAESMGCLLASRQGATDTLISLCAASEPNCLWPVDVGEPGFLLCWTAHSSRLLAKMTHKATNYKLQEVRTIVAHMRKNIDVVDYSPAVWSVKHNTPMTCFDGPVSLCRWAPDGLYSSRPCGGRGQPWILAPRQGPLQDTLITECYCCESQQSWQTRCDRRWQTRVHLRERKTCIFLYIFSWKCITQ